MQKIAFVFPGQGSQTVGMLQSLAVNQPIIKQTFDEASNILNYDLWELTQTDLNGKLNQTEFTQPALLVAGVAMWRLWQQLSDIRPMVLAGHSLGEYTALVCAEALSLTTAVKLVRKRGQLMQAAVSVGEGAMAAILGLAADKLIALCAAVTGSVVEAVNFNAPGQIVIAGHKLAVEQVMLAAKNAGAKRVILLPLSVPSHCSLMQPAAERLADDLAAVDWKTTIYPVIHNFDLTSHNESTKIINSLVKQLYNPVRWIETIQKIKCMGVNLVIECGPGKILTCLNKKIAEDLRYLAISDPAELNAAVEEAYVAT